MKKLLLCLMALFVIIPTSLAQDETPVISPTLIENLDTIEAQTAELRGLAALQPVTRLFPNRQAVIDFVTADINEQLDQQTAFEELQFYRAFDFVDAPLDLLDVYTTLIGSQVAGFYDPDTQEMNVLLISGDTLGDELPLLESITYSHEFVHALQDQHFDLAAFFTEFAESEGMDNPDEIIARQSLVEGDATLVMQDYTLQAVMDNPMGALALLDPDLLAAAEIPAGTPFILEAELTFPYITGMEFVTALRDAGGWDLVNAAYTENPPESTEHILHPERYLAGDSPLSVTVTSGLDTLGDGWVFVFERTLGEFYLRQYLGTQIGRGVLNAAATGWGGDRFQLYYNDANDERAWILHLVMDTPEDATEFATTFGQFASLRSGGTVANESPAGMACALNAVQETLCYTSDGGNGLYIAFAPSMDDAAALINAQG
ncbi:MAG: hypothetical protein RLP44_20755 [Aggregatilineales bacterium]